jgi:hypothetical protein
MPSVNLTDGYKKEIFQRAAVMFSKEPADLTKLQNEAGNDLHAGRKIYEKRYGDVLEALTTLASIRPDFLIQKESTFHVFIKHPLEDNDKKTIASIGADLGKVGKHSAYNSYRTFGGTAKDTINGFVTRAEREIIDLHMLYKGPQPSNNSVFLHISEAKDFFREEDIDKLVEQSEDARQEAIIGSRFLVQLLSMMITATTVRKFLKEWPEGESLIPHELLQKTKEPTMKATRERQIQNGELEVVPAIKNDMSHALAVARLRNN